MATILSFTYLGSRIRSASSFPSLHSRHVYTIASGSTNQCRRTLSRRSAEFSYPLVSSSKRTSRRRLSFAALFLSTGLVGSSSFAYCAANADEGSDQDTFQVPPFDDAVLTFDHYNGVTLHLDKLTKNVEDPLAFQEDLRQALSLWRKEGKKGVWIYAPSTMAHLIPVS